MASMQSPERARQLQELGTRLLVLQEKTESAAGCDETRQQALLAILDQCITDTVTAFQTGDLSCLEIDTSRVQVTLSLVEPGPATDNAIGAADPEASAGAHDAPAHRGWFAWMKRTSDSDAHHTR